MITKFKIEGEGNEKDTLTDELTAHASRIISEINDNGQPRGKWECTDDAVVGSPSRRYKGRMVLQFHGDGSGYLGLGFQ
jgi:hypothetical protein